IYYGTKDIIQTLDSKIVAGRAFRDGDHGVGPATDPANVTVISKSVADALFPGEEAIGKTMEYVSATGQVIGEPVTVIGVIEYFYNPFGHPGSDPMPHEVRAMFLPARAGSYANGLRYLVRTEPGAMASVIAETEKRLMGINSGRVFEFTTTPEKKQGWFSGSAIMVTTLTCIIVALVAVTALGLLGLTSLEVSERTKQIGTRRALGATRGDILGHFLMENWLITTAGLLIGVLGAYGLNLLLVSHVSDVKLDWQLVAAGMVLLWINGLLSTVPPALRATMLSPSIATRSV
ncbi:MAG TPA: FtsX-like permease family protein, partial [Thermoanaerobaculia bacterium]